MRCGTVLRADVYLPGGTGPWPVLLSRLPYGKQKVRHADHGWRRMRIWSTLCRNARSPVPDRVGRAMGGADRARLQLARPEIRAALEDR
ncbi:CocE/NonD family hydrolase [Nonomuraea guangzhouensis]|uniref:CocE/NonD family hydrolase n=1 Tax=Nonomuraea guangzhouensis TaxID=1291555 RepID=A0ABW4GUP4_9ACTN